MTMYRLFRGTDWNEVQGAFDCFHADQTLNFPIAEGPDSDTTQSQGNGLQADILGGMSGFQVDIPDPTVTVLGRGSFENRKYGNCYRRFGDSLLVQTRLGQLCPQITSKKPQEFMTHRLVTVNPCIQIRQLPGNQVYFQGVQRAS
jgi:hypothetical protein